MVVLAMFTAAACGEAPAPESTAASVITTTSAPSTTSTPVAATSTSAPPTTAAAEPETLILRFWQKPGTLNPYLSGAYKDRDAAAITLEPLAAIAPDGTVVPSLAAEIPTIGNGGIAPDHSSITWLLRPGALWSDGSPVTADDVVFTWEYCVTLGSRCGTQFDGIRSVQALNDQAVRIEYDDPPSYPYLAFVGATGVVLNQAQFAGCGGERAEECGEENSLPLGTGPYRVTEFSPDGRVLYERNPHYRGEPAYFDHVRIVGGGDAVAAAEAVLVAGEADYAWNTQVAPDVLARLEAAGVGEAVAALSSTVERIMVNHTNPDPALGQDRSEYLDGANPHPFLTYLPIPRAMSMAIDRQRIADELYGFQGRPACNIVVEPLQFRSSANDGCLTQDIAAARTLLDTSGVVDTDGDGIREYRDTPLRVTYQTSENEVRRRTQELIRDWWLEIGIEANLVRHDATLFFGDPHLEGGEASYLRFYADLEMYASGTGVDPQAALAGGLCAEIPTRANGWTGNNIERACDPEYDQLYAELAAAPLGPERDELVRQLNDMLVQRFRMIPLVQRGLTDAHANDLLGVQPNAWDSPLWNIAEWRRRP